MVVIFVIIVVRLGPSPLAGLPVRFSCCAFKQVIKTFQKRLIAFFNAFMPFLPQIPDPFVLLFPFSRARAPGQSFAQPVPSARRGQKEDFEFPMRYTRDGSTSGFCCAEFLAPGACVYDGARHRLTMVRRRQGACPSDYRPLCEAAEQEAT